MERGYDIQAYRDILKVLGERYTFTTHAESEQLRQSGEPFIILRHDIDYSLELAVVMAGINAEVGVRSTFFVLLRSQVYNLLSKAGLSAIRQIAQDRQHLGLHAHFPEMPNEDVGAAIQADLDLCRSSSGVDFVDVVAWHNATAEELSQPSPLAASPLLCVYDRPFFGVDHYMSDSNMGNSVAQLMSLDPSEHPCVQLLFHPINWLPGGGDMQEILRHTFVQVMEEKAEEFRTNRCWQGLEFNDLRVR